MDQNNTNSDSNPNHPNINYPPLPDVNDNINQNPTSSQQIDQTFNSQQQNNNETPSQNQNSPCNQQVKHTTEFPNDINSNQPQQTNINQQETTYPNQQPNQNPYKLPNQQQNQFQYQPYDQHPNPNINTLPQPNDQPNPKPEKAKKPPQTAKRTYSQQSRFTDDELFNQVIADENKSIVLNKKFPITPSDLIMDAEYEIHYENTEKSVPKGRPNIDSIYINPMTTIWAAISLHEKYPNDSICLLNFADAFKCGGGYLNGRMAQEETLCRQTLLYPTLEKNDMYSINKADKNNVYLYDTMIYSPDVFVIRDDSYEMLGEKSFKVNIISAPAVDKRIKNSRWDMDKIMQRRIKKIILLAAYKKNTVLILGAFGCGVFKNDPYKVSQIFKKILIDECMANFFKEIWFPIYKNDKNYEIFRKTFGLK